MFSGKFAWRVVSWDLAACHIRPGEGTLFDSIAHSVNLARYGMELRDHGDPLSVEALGQVTEGGATRQGLTDLAGKSVSDDCCAAWEFYIEAVNDRDQRGRDWQLRILGSDI